MTVVNKDYFLFSHYKNPHYFPVYVKLYLKLFLFTSYCECHTLFSLDVFWKVFWVFPIISWVSYSWSIFTFSSVSLLYMHWHLNPARSESCNFALAEHLSTNDFIVVELKSWHIAVQTCRTRTSYLWFVQTDQIASVEGYVRVVLVYNYGN